MTDFQLSRRALLGTGIAGLLLAKTASAKPIQSTRPRWDSIQKAATDAIDQRFMPGLSLCVMRDGEILFSEGLGKANLETGLDATPQTVYRIASITKQFVSVVLLKLQETGKLSLNDTLAKYVPEFPRAERMTLYQLATHTAGLGNYSNTPDSEREERLDFYDEKALLDLYRSSDPLFASSPGDEERYSNTGYGLLGLAITRATDRWWGEIVQDECLSPLGLNHTAVDDGYTIVPNRASGYMPYPDAETGFINAPHLSMTYVGAAGAMRSTAEELCQWHQALLTGKVLKAESFTKLTSPVQTKSGLSQYAMGLKRWEPHSPFATRDTLSHGGRLNGFASHLWSFPEKKVTVAMLTNSDGGRLQEFGKAFDSIRDPATKLALGMP